MPCPRLPSSLLAKPLFHPPSAEPSPVAFCKLVFRLQPGRRPCCAVQRRQCYPPAIEPLGGRGQARPRQCEPSRYRTYRLAGSPLPPRSGPCLRRPSPPRTEERKRRQERSESESRAQRSPTTLSPRERDAKSTHLKGISRRTPELTPCTKGRPR